MKTVVFGGSGFLGSHVADELSNKGHEVIIFDLKKSPYLRDDQKMILGNVLSCDQVLTAVEGCDYVYNFAGIADLDDATTKPIETVNLNIAGNINILDASRKSNIKRYVYASTIYVYSHKGGFYRCSKQASELYIEEYQRQYSQNFTVLRYGTLYGPRADDRNAIHCYLKQAMKGDGIDCFGTGEELREYINVKDAARLSVDILDEEFKNRHIIITGHYPMRSKEMVFIIKEILGKDIQIRFTGRSHPDHYEYTPYSFIPKIGQKLVSNCYLDMGQGLLECLNELTLNK